MMLEKQGITTDIVISISVLVIISVYVGHLYLDELVSGVQWIASEVVSPMFGLDSYF